MKQMGEFIGFAVGCSRNRRSALHFGEHDPRGGLEPLGMWGRQREGDGRSQLTSCAGLRQMPEEKKRRSG